MECAYALWYDTNGMPHVSSSIKSDSCFIYDSFSVNLHKTTLVLQWRFLLDDRTVFLPTTTMQIENCRALNLSEIRTAVFNLGLVEVIDYWRVTRAPIIKVNAGYLNADQIRWWEDLYLNGLAEYFYTNNIDFVSKRILKIVSPKNAISSRGAAPSSFMTKRKHQTPDIVLVGGGKDSAVTLSMYRKSMIHAHCLVINPQQAALKNCAIAGFHNPIIVRRKTDPKLILLIKAGHTSGHTPWSAYTSFAGVLVALVWHAKNVVISNERSASEANLKYKGANVNHQYSKSYRFERLFRDYVNTYISKDINFFSLLRPLSELQIVKQFVKSPEYFLTFRSCNASANNRWCCRCAKCAFIYLTLSSFLEKEILLEIFHQDLFYDNRITMLISYMVGLSRNKPFDCVGTYDEAKLALALTMRRYNKSNVSIPIGLRAVWNKLHMNESEVKKLTVKELEYFSPRHFLPSSYVANLKRLLKSD